MESLPSDTASLSYQGYHIFSLMQQMRELGGDGFGREYEDMLNAQWNAIPTTAKTDYQDAWDTLQEEYENIDIRKYTEETRQKMKRVRVGKKAQIIADTLNTMKILYNNFNTDFDKAYIFSIQDREAGE